MLTRLDWSIAFSFSVPRFLPCAAVFCCRLPILFLLLCSTAKPLIATMFSSDEVVIGRVGWSCVILGLPSFYLRIPRGFVLTNVAGIAVSSLLSFVSFATAIREFRHS